MIDASTLECLTPRQKKSAEVVNRLVKNALNVEKEKVDVDVVDVDDVDIADVVDSVDKIDFLNEAGSPTTLVNKAGSPTTLVNEAIGVSEVAMNVIDGMISQAIKNDEINVE